MRLLAEDASRREAFRWFGSRYPEGGGGRHQDCAERQACWLPVQRRNFVGEYCRIRADVYAIGDCAAFQLFAR